MPGLITTGSPKREAIDTFPERLHGAGTVGPEDARLRHRRAALADPHVEMVERRCAKADQDFPGAGRRIGDLVEDEHLGASIVVDPNRLHERHTIHVTGPDLERLGEALGLDAIGATPAVAYEETERHIRERRARGLFADMKFTMAQPERSCHPETLLPGARTVVSAALCYYAPEPERPAANGRLPRYTWYDAYRRAAHEARKALGRELAAPTASWSMRTSMSTARLRSAAASASTARTRF